MLGTRKACKTKQTCRYILCTACAQQTDHEVFQVLAPKCLWRSAGLIRILLKHGFCALPETPALKRHTGHALNLKAAPVAPAYWLTGSLLSDVWAL